MATPTIVTPRPLCKGIPSFYDSAVGGLVPVVVVAVAGDGNARTDRITLNDARVIAVVAVNRSAYHKGEVLSEAPYRVWARQHVRQSHRSPHQVVVEPHDHRQLLRTV